MTSDARQDAGPSTIPKVILPPYIVERDFLSAATVQALIDYTLDHEPDFTSTRVLNGDCDPGVRVSRSTRALGPFAAIMEQHVLARLPRFIERLQVTPFDLGRVELELVAHGDGAFYKSHVDTQTGAVSQKHGMRILSAVYYFNVEPKGFTGGALRLFGLGDLDEVPQIDIEPTHNSLLVFPSWVPHEVRPVRSPSGRFVDSRFAINCWLRRKPPT